MSKSRSTLVRASKAFHGLVRRSLSFRDPTSTTIRITIAAAAPSFAAADDSNRKPNIDSTQQATKDPPNRLDVEHESKHIVQSLSEQLSFGAVLGFATGYSIRKIGKLVLFLAGTEVVILQYMAYRRWLEIDWRRIGRDLSPNFDRSAWDCLMNILLYKMPFSAAFSGGLAAGLRLSYQK
ncbi:unnamed protein product [Agarophyton chilense]